ncbi:MAG TPA: hypothetical protein VIX12_07530, partial [Candidatus Binataceae bacterium]
FKSGAGYLALRSGFDVLPVNISGTHEVLGKGSLVPRRHPVEVRIGSAIANEKLRALAENAESTGAYRKLADFMRDAVVALGTKRAPLERRNRDQQATIESSATQPPAPEPDHADTSARRRRAKA